VIEDILRRLLGMPTTKERDERIKLEIAIMGGHEASAEYFGMWGTVSECKQCGWVEYSRCETKEDTMNTTQMKCYCGELMHDRKATKEDYKKFDVDDWFFAEREMQKIHAKLWDKYHVYVPRMTMKEFWELSPEEKLPTRMKEIINDHIKETTRQAND